MFQKTVGYSGSDLHLVCKEAAMRPVRKIFDTLETHQQGRYNVPGSFYKILDVVQLRD